ncbi:Phosphoesterase HXTX [Stanieria cyanosphaera PCC 7437]|uniref:Phosphoesterase HXTX n=1 Tax=Stanieria cyanosphaera (strain ATCC 29371 / PCC 7437) TaxID=111780 RepID=K9XV92_STAC7|nr:2'-5' RNA ligase family protein [Stanieria cyanosphaera]AFZ36520.1 Phosphoesterase HXTX [Stanieria cyanosphaera PCC 7437]
MVNQTKQLYFIALLPPAEIQTVVTEIKQHFAKIYNSKAALKSPPHVTLQAPFHLEKDNLPVLEKKLAEFVKSESTMPMILDGFSAFRPRVIYVNVLKTPELLTIQTKLTNHLESTLGIVHRAAKSRPFAPHMTVGFKDLTKTNFYQAWEEFKDQKIYFEFTVSNLTLLTHNGSCWEIYREFLLAG